MCKLLCCYCCTEKPKRDFENDKKLCGPCCKGVKCVIANKACCGLDSGSGHYEYLLKHPLNPEKVGVYEYRPMMSQQAPGNLSIQQDIPKGPWQRGCSSGIFCCTPCFRLDCAECLMGSCLKAQKARQESEYTFIMENRIEMNRPSIILRDPRDCKQYCCQTCCVCFGVVPVGWLASDFGDIYCLPTCAFCFGEFGIQDNVAVHYYDDSMFDYATGANPCCHGTRVWCCGGYNHVIRLRRRCFLCPPIEMFQTCCAQNKVIINTTAEAHQPSIDAIKAAVQAARKDCKPAKDGYEMTALKGGADDAGINKVTPENMER